MLCYLLPKKINSSFSDDCVVQVDITPALIKREHESVKKLIFSAKANHCHFTRRIRNVAQHVIKGKIIDIDTLNLLKYELELALDSVVHTDPEIEHLLLPFKEDAEMSIVSDSATPPPPSKPPSEEYHLQHMNTQGVGVSTGLTLCGSHQRDLNPNIVSSQHNIPPRTSPGNRAFNFKKTHTPSSLPSGTYVSVTTISLYKILFFRF